MRVPMSQRLTPRQMDIAAITICVGMSLLAYFVGLAPAMEHRTQRATQGKQWVSCRQDLSRLSNAVLALNRRLSAAREELNRCEVKLESADRINTRVAQLTGLLSECELQVDTLQPGQVLAGAQYSLIPITVQGKGGFVQALSFLRRLGSALRDVGAIQFSLSGDPSKPAEPGEFKVDLFAYAAPKGMASG
jgi:Tfp pilus assembly protein PilO